MSAAHNVAREAAALGTGIAGEVFVPGDPGYDQARQTWMLSVDERPAIVVQAESEDDVIAAVRFARSHGLRVAPQGTGHGAGPLEPLDSALLLRTSRMRGVRIDPDTQTARADAGTLWQDVTVPAGDPVYVPLTVPPIARVAPALASRVPPVPPLRLVSDSVPACTWSRPLGNRPHHSL